MNRCIFVGRTTRDVEIHYTRSNNTAVAKFSIAVDSGYGDNKKTSFFNMTAWGKTAEALEKYSRKGTKLILECQAAQNQYTDKNGNKVNAIDFTVLNFEFAEKRTEQKNNNTNKENLASFTLVDESIEDTDFPF